MFGKQQHIKLPLRNMALGLNEFDYCLDDNFFESLNNSDFSKGCVNLTINAEKYNHCINIEVEFEGELRVSCDRCLDEFMMPIEGEALLSVRFSKEIPQDDTEDIESEEDIMYADSEDEELDLTDYVYESIYLALPMQRIHPNIEGKSTCNPEMMKYLSNDSENKNSPFASLKDKIN